MSLYDCVNDIPDPREYESCVEALRRQDFFTSGTSGNSCFFIRYRRTLYDDDSKIVAEKFAYFSH